MAAMHEKLLHSEYGGNLVEAAGNGVAVQNPRTGEILSTQVAMRRAQLHATSKEAADKEVIKFSKKAEAAYKWRNYMLFSGFLLLVVARILVAYV
ncbi:MAG: hypothetical protein ABIK96_02015 [bacterium]